jgi:hypothetical protein
VEPEDGRVGAGILREQLDVSQASISRALTAFTYLIFPTDDDIFIELFGGKSPASSKKTGGFGKPLNSLAVTVV